MSDDANDGNGNRATIALVNSKIDTVLARVDGNAQVTEAHFETIKTRLDGLGDLPSRIDAVETRLNGRIDTETQKVTALQSIVSEIQRGRVWRSTVLPQILIGLGTIALGIIALHFTGGSP